MRADISNDPPYAYPPRSAHEPLDQDLYCLTCGYNLRGLFGDPARCPECGELNDLGTAAIPAEMIRKALRAMETAPTVCAAFAFATGWFVTIVAFVGTDELICVATGGLLLVVLWGVAYAVMQEAYHHQPGWRRILVDFHVAVFLCTLLIPGLMVAAPLADAYPESIFRIILFCILVACVAFFMWGLRVYAGAKSRIAAVQLDEAVRIARDMLHEALQRRRD